MISSFHAILLGALQGLTEFLPISSSGHLVLVPYIFNWNYQGIAFDVALHAGTAIAIVLFFWQDWISIIRKALFKNAKVTDQNVARYPDNLLWQIIVAAVPAGIIGMLIAKIVESTLHSVLLIAFNLVFFGLLLWYIDRKAKSDLKPQELTYGKSLLIGLSQSIALIPGVSRSGITLTACRWIGLEREEAARFSFLLATPTIVGAFIIKLPSIIGESLGASFWFGILASTIFGILAIKFLLNYLKKSDLSLFLWYRLVLALLVVAFYIWRR